MYNIIFPLNYNPDCRGITIYELINGTGKGKEYANDGNLIFEGEYLNGQRNGKGKEYDKHGNLRFEGEYLYNQKRKGKEYVNNRLEYEGEYLYGRKWNGKGYNKKGNKEWEIKNGKGQGKENYYLKENI